MLIYVNIWMSILPPMSLASWSSGNCCPRSESRAGVEALCVELLVCSALSFVTDWRHEENYCMFMYMCVYIYIMLYVDVYVKYMSMYMYLYMCGCIHHGYVDGMKTMSINRNQLFWCKQKGTRVLNGSGRNLSYGVSISLNTVPLFFKRLRWQ